MRRDHVAVVVAVAVEEFEAWLLADWVAVSTVVEPPPDEPGPRETLVPGACKRLLHDIRGAVSESSLRRTLAATCDLERVRDSCPSFRRFLDDLAQRIVTD